MTDMVTPNPRFRPGDRVRIAEIDRIGQRTGTHRTGVVIPAPFDDGYFRVQVDGIGRPIVFDGFRLEPIAEQDVIGDHDELEPLESLLRKESTVIEAVAATIAEAEQPVTEIAACVGMSLHALAARLDGTLTWTVTELVVLASFLGVWAGDWFRPFDEQQEVIR